MNRYGRTIRFSERGFAPSLSFRVGLTEDVMHPKLSFAGFSPKRVSYALLLISALLLPLHALTKDYRGDEVLGTAGVLLMGVIFLLCWFIPRTDKNRFVPFVLSFFAVFGHMLLQKL